MSCDFGDISGPNEVESLDQFTDEFAPIPIGALPPKSNPINRRCNSILS
jgi:hypothetical protein